MFSQVVFSAVFLAIVVHTRCDPASNKPPQFSEIRRWSYLNFTWPDDGALLRNATQQGKYIPENIVMSGLGYWDRYYYISLPRMRDGVPATLCRISESPAQKTGALLEPYPSWAANELNDCDALQNVQNIEVDAAGRLWVIDGGRTATLTTVPIVRCSPKLVVIDLATNDVLFSYTFPENVASRELSYLYDIVVDGSFAYITDNSGKDPGIIVFSAQKQSAWKVRHNDSMRADPDAKDFSVADIKVSTPINIAGIALGPMVNIDDNGNAVVQDEKRVYYSPLSSFYLYSISSSVLQQGNPSDSGDELDVMTHGRKQTQTDGMLMDDKGMLYFSLLGISGIARWNTSVAFDRGQELMAKDPKYVQWPNSFAFNGKGDIVALVDNLHKFIYGKMSLDDYNFRLLAAPVNGRSYVYADNPLNYEHVDTNATSTSSVIVESSTEDMQNQSIDRNDFINVTSTDKSDQSVGTSTSTQANINVEYQVDANITIPNEASETNTSKVETNLDHGTASAVSSTQPLVTTVLTMMFLSIFI